MSAKVDYTLYEAIKRKFSVKHGQLGLIELVSDQADELVMHIYERSQAEESRNATLTLHELRQPHACFSWRSRRYLFIYMGKDFYQEEDLQTGEIVYFQLEPYQTLFGADRVDENVRRELALLAKLLAGDSQSS